jgi:predicted RNA-binding protein with PUA-like domain
VLFYHSSADPPVVAGLARVASPPRPDPSAWDRKSPSYDPKASAENPIWQLFDVEFVEKFAAPVALADLRRQKRLRGLALLERGQRLSVLPVSAAHFAAIRALAKGRS